MHIPTTPKFTTFFSLIIVVNTQINKEEQKYGLLSLFGVVCLYIFRAFYMVLDKQSGAHPSIDYFSLPQQLSLHYSSSSTGEDLCDLFHL